MIVALACFLLRIEKRRLELGPYDFRRSRRLDAVVAALEALR
jgi:hypothetical protein